MKQVTHSLPSHQNGFTLLRLLAAFSVLFTHSYVSLGLGEDPLAKASHLTALSGIGVDVFFAISGYLVCKSLLNQPSPLLYLRNRFLRIFPALCVLVVITTFVVGPWLTVEPNYWECRQTYAYLANMFIYPLHPYLPGVFASIPVSVINGSLWTLPIEMTCYLFLLALSWSRALNARTLILLILILLTLHIRDTFIHGQNIAWMGLFHLDRLSTIFLGGSLLAILKPTFKLSWAYLFLALLIVVIAWMNGHENWHHFAFFYILLLPYIVVSVATALKHFHWLNKYDFSYGFYLYSFLVEQCCVNILGTHMSVAYLTTVATIITFLLAMLSWFIVEKPALNLKNKVYLKNKIGIDSMSPLSI